MFGLFKNKKELLSKHTHEFNITIGNYYKLYRTEYRNCFDEVRIYERKQCACGAYKDFLVSRDEFLPSLHENDKDEKAFIAKIKNNSIEEEFEINIRTKMYSNRNDCYNH